MAKKKTSAGEAKSRKTVKASQEIPPEKYFVLCDGTRIKDMHELALMLDRISDEQFGYHVNDSKNDFSNWIRDVFGQHELADALSGITCRKDSQIYLLKHVVTKKR
ncbi:hypothetical protein KY363_06565 [Candidatus Woesearchaeota archaeon]|nr:hypothetical protein [Candidatus Woesearchaeota archaeon]